MFAWCNTKLDKQNVKQLATHGDSGYAKQTTLQQTTQLLLALNYCAWSHAHRTQVPATKHEAASNLATKHVIDEHPRKHVRLALCSGTLVLIWIHSLIGDETVRVLHSFSELQQKPESWSMTLLQAERNTKREKKRHVLLFHPLTVALFSSKGSLELQNFLPVAATAPGLHGA